MDLYAGEKRIVTVPGIDGLLQGILQVFPDGLQGYLR